MVESFITALQAEHDVQALALSGSRTGVFGDEYSDYDLYVYSKDPLQVDTRLQLAEQYADQAEVGNDFFGEGDEMILKDGRFLDVMYRSLEWAEEHVQAVWLDHRPSVGYSTAFIHTIRSATILYDPTGRFATLQNILKNPYPSALQEAIIAKNYPLLRSKLMASYYAQIELAIKRVDLLSQAHRTVALMSSYFDIIFAINGQTHPGEKKLIAWANTTCSVLPVSFERDVEQVLRHIGYPSQLGYIEGLLDNLDDLLKRRGEFPSTSKSAVL